MFVGTHFIFGRVLLAAFAVILLADRPAPAQSSEQLLAEVKAAWTARQHAIKSARFTWSQKTLHPKGRWGQNPPLPANDVIDNGSGSLLMSGEKVRIHTVGLIWTQPISDFARSESESVFDGNRYISLKHPGFLQWHQAVISKRYKGNPDGNMIELWPFMVALRGVEPLVIGDLFSSYSESRRVSIGGRTLIEMVRPRNETQGESKLWLDEKRGYSVERCEDYSRSGQLQSRIDATPAVVASEWVPHSCKVQIWKSDKRLERQAELTVRECEINLATTTADFEIAFPTGTRVVDNSERTADGRGERKDYIVRDDGTKRDILPSEIGATYEDLIRTQPGDLDGRSPRSWWTLRRLSLLFGLVATGFGLLLLLNRWRKKTVRLPPVNDSMG